ncbi:putative aarF domain-containing protein kinase 1 [Artemisia annua]|uniref:Putative aarF domain-containing protein kinase 1 n=1 Tax=Artemisia annua TaxID=35608 RepID=A0A2U1LH00_ARTAN|nr:putative aarF domain-containing protein kinase 1 [Artemisia annua]
MRESMLNRCPTSTYDQVCKVVKKELGGAPEEIFDEFDPVPIASASLAQVHVARTHEGQKVAVKVQHTHMTDTAAADLATVELIVNTVHRFFPSFDYRWLVDEVKETSPKLPLYVRLMDVHYGLLTLLLICFDDGYQELDFLNEAKNSVKCMDNFRRLSPHIAAYIYAPTVYWSLSTSKLLTMEFIEAPQVNDLKSIKKLGIRPHDISKLVSQTFAEMMFKHGFVHCDPHVANLLVRTLPSDRSSIFGSRKPQLVLLDHGLYKELDNYTRTSYAALWKALVLADAKAIKENCKKFGAGDDLYTFFTSILTMKPWERVIDPAVDHLAISDQSELQIYGPEYFSQVTELLRRLPRVILLMMKTNDCLRSVDNALLQRSSLESFLIIGRVSSEAVIQEKLLKAKSLFSLISVWLEEISLEVRFTILRLALWVLQFKKSLSL